MEFMERRQSFTSRQLFRPFRDSRYDFLLDVCVYGLKWCLFLSYNALSGVGTFPRFSEYL